MAISDAEVECSRWRTAIVDEEHLSIINLSLGEGVHRLVQVLYNG